MRGSTQCYRIDGVTVSTMEEPTAVEHCPNCGAPLELDATGDCHWCHARIAVSEGLDLSGMTASEAASIIKVDRHDHLALPDGSVFLPLPAFPILSALSLAAYDNAVQTFLDVPERLPSVRALAAAVQVAGERIQDSDASDSDVTQHGEKLYTPAEWWTFELIIDLLAALGAINGIERDTRSSTRETVNLYDEMWARRIRKPLKHAGDGPEPLRALRASVPHRRH